MGSETCMIIYSYFIILSIISIIHLYTLVKLSWITSTRNWLLLQCLFKECLYSGCHNTIGIWSTSGSFQHLGNIPHNYGSIYSLAITHEFLIAGIKFIISAASLIKTLCWKQKFSILNKTLLFNISGIIFFLGTYNRNIQVFNLSNNQHVFSLRGHIGVVTSLTVTPSGRFLVSSSSDQTIMVKWFHVTYIFKINLGTIIIIGYSFQENFLQSKTL